MATLQDLDIKRSELNQAIADYTQAVQDLSSGTATQADVDAAKSTAQTLGDEYAKLISQVKKDDPNVTNDDQLFSTPELMTASVRQNVRDIMITGQHERPMIWVVDTTRNPTGYTDQAELALRGTANSMTVDWGDGVVESNITENRIHTYPSPGVYEIKLWGLLDYRWPTNSNFYKTLVDVKQWGNTVDVVKYLNFFRSTSDFTITAEDAPTIRPGGNVGYMFAGTNFNGDISHWDTSNATVFYNMFRTNAVFNRDLSMWDVSNGTNFNSMFEDALSFDQDISSWDVSSAEVYNNFATNSPIDATAKMPNFPA